MTSVPAAGEADRIILDEAEMGRTLTRMAHEICEINRGADDLVIIGIQTRGVQLAHRLKALVDEIEHANVPIGQLDITLYRDDLRKNPTRAVGPTKVPFSLEDRIVVLVDDVLFSGRTVVAALDALKDLVGRPRSVELAVLIDRGHREFPISPDVIGRQVPTAADERISVTVSEIDDRDEVVLSRVGGQQ